MSVDYSFLLSQMTLEEKASMCSGSTFWLTQPVERLGIPCVWVSDGPNGLRKEKRSAGLNLMGTSETSTCFPSSATTANSWDVSLMKEIGHAIAGEAKALSVTTVPMPLLKLVLSQRLRMPHRSISPIRGTTRLLAYEIKTALMQVCSRGFSPKGVNACFQRMARNT